MSLSLPSEFNVADYFFRPILDTPYARQPYLVLVGGAGREGQAGGATGNAGGGAIPTAPNPGDPGVLTPQAAWEQAGRVANALAALGVRAEERVMILMPQSLEFPAVFWGVIRLGAVALPVNPALLPHEQGFFLADSRARLLVADARLWPALAPVVAALPHPPLVILSGDGPPPLPPAPPARLPPA